MTEERNLIRIKTNLKNVFVITKWASNTYITGEWTTKAYNKYGGPLPLVSYCASTLEAASKYHLQLCQSIYSIYKE